MPGIQIFTPFTMADYRELYDFCAIIVMNPNVTKAEKVRAQRLAMKVEAVIGQQAPRPSSTWGFTKGLTTCLKRPAAPTFQDTLTAKKKQRP